MGEPTLLGYLGEASSYCDFHASGVDWFQRRDSYDPIRTGGCKYGRSLRPSPKHGSASGQPVTPGQSVAGGSIGSVNPAICANARTYCAWGSECPLRLLSHVPFLEGAAVIGMRKQPTASAGRS